jgi:hypothetical protein
VGEPESTPELPPGQAEGYVPVVARMPEALAEDQAERKRIADEAEAARIAAELEAAEPQPPA